jgi:hypothetical protein
MTDRPTPPPSPIYGVARPDRGDVVIDVSDAAISRLVELLLRRPSLLGTLGDACAPTGRRRHLAIAALRADRDVRATCTVRLEVGVAVDLAASIIAAAAPDVAPSRKDPDR